MAKKRKTESTGEEPVVRKVVITDEDDAAMEDLTIEDPTIEDLTLDDFMTEEDEEEEVAPPEPTELEKALAEKAAEHERYLLLAAEYDNFRKRSQREKDELYQRATADAAKKFLPVYDNLLRALQNETADEAYKKGVEMTMNELKKILSSMGIEAFGAVGEAFDPNKHNAVMHIEDDALGENVIAELFQTGFAMGDRVIRFAMVKVAN